MDKQSNILRSLLEAQKKVEAVTKDAKNEYAGYQYASAEAIIIEGRQCLIFAGLILHRRSWTIDIERRLVVQKLQLSHPESGETLEDIQEIPYVETKGKGLDKSVASALTTGLSYYLRDLLLIPRVSEEMDKRDDKNIVPSKAEIKAKIVAEEVSDEPPLEGADSAEEMIALYRLKKEGAPLTDKDKAWITRQLGTEDWSSASEPRIQRVMKILESK